MPIIGNTSHLRSATKKYGSQIDAFRAWEKEYKSPLIGLKLGNELVVAALNYPLIHEIHTNEAFDGRPDNFFLRLRTMGSRLVDSQLMSKFVEFFFLSILCFFLLKARRNMHRW